MLFYLKFEIIGDQLADQITFGISCREAQFTPPIDDGYPGMPAWWDVDSDKSLLMGVYKHGYDHYSLMRQDPALCFLSRCGPPDKASLLAEIQTEDDLEKPLEDEEDSESVSNAINSNAANSIAATNNETEEDTESNTVGHLPFPPSSDMNKRLRTLIAAYQKNFRRQEAKMAQQARNQQRLEKLEKYEAALRERELKKREQAQRYVLINSFKFIVLLFIITFVVFFIITENGQDVKNLTFIELFLLLVLNTINKKTNTIGINLEYCLS